MTAAPNGARRAGDSQHHAVVNRVGVPVAHGGAAHAGRRGLDGIHDVGALPFAEVGHTLDQLHCASGDLDRQQRQGGIFDGVGRRQ